MWFKWYIDLLTTFHSFPYCTNLWVHEVHIFHFSPVTEVLDFPVPLKLYLRLVPHFLESALAD